MYEEDPDENEQDAEPDLEAWVRIQKTTFTNWVNDKLRIHDMEVENIRKDFKDGIKLCKLMEALKGRRIGRLSMKPNLNHYEASGNLQVAFTAMNSDGVRLVNIGAEDITAGNIKLILGMLWTLIRRYQIGSQSKLPPKAMMLSWCNAILYPHMKVKNFSTDWSDGLALHGLIEYCCPGSCPQWYTMSPSDRVGNCENAMHMATELFEIPMVMRPEDMASRDVDELSGMTYLSYFMADNTPGYKATLNWTRTQISPTPVDNFEKDWNNGYILSSLVTSLGGQIPNWPDIEQDWVVANATAINTARDELEIEPVLKGKDLANPEVDHIGVMAHAAWHEASLKKPAPMYEEPPPPPPPPPVMIPGPTIISLGEPSNAPEVDVSITEKWRIDYMMTIEAETVKVAPGSITAEAEAPSGMRLNLAATQVDDKLHRLEFMPTEKGNWKVIMLYNGEGISGSPFDVNVYDPSAAKITRDYGVANQNEPFSFEVDVHHVGVHDVSIYVVHEGVSVPHEVSQDGLGKYRVTFTPIETGSYTVAVYAGGTEVPGSPFDVVCKVVEGIFARGSGLSSGIQYHQAEFHVETDAAPGKSLDITIYGPSGQGILPDTARMNDSLHKINFTPQETGVHTIDVMYNGVHISGSPFKAEVRRPQVYVQDLGVYAFTNQKTQFKINASEMKKGRLEIDSDLPVVSYDKLGQNMYQVTFVPNKSGPHDMVIKYNEEEVQGCPFIINVKPGV